MGLYRTEFARVSEFAFIDDTVKTWDQHIPHIGNVVLLGMNKSVEKVLSAEGEANLELLGVDSTDLDTPIRAGIRSKGKFFEGFYYTHRGMTQRTSVPEGFDELVITEDMGGKVTLLNSGEPISQIVSREATNAIIPVVGMQFCQKLIQLDNDINPELQALIDEMNSVA